MEDPVCVVRAGVDVHHGAGEEPGKGLVGCEILGASCSGSAWNRSLFDWEKKGTYSLSGLSCCPDMMVVMGCYFSR